MEEGRGKEEKEGDQLKRVAKAAGIVSARERCGVCPGCRLEGAKLGCYRVAAGRQLGYQPQKIAKMLLEEQGPPEEEGEEGTPSAMATGHDGSGSDGDGGAVEDNEHGNAPSSSRRTVHKANTSGDDKRRFEWVERPRFSSATSKSRAAHAQRAAAALRHADTTMTSLLAAEDAAAINALAASFPLGLSVPVPPDGVTVPAPPHAALLAAAEDCAAAAMAVALVPEDDPDADVPLPPPAQQRRGLQRAPVRCTLCGGWHTLAQVDECPALRAALAIERKEEEGGEGEGVPHCASAEFPGCNDKNCKRRVVPKAAWTPSKANAPWLERVPVTTRGVMRGLQATANAATVDFDRPDVAGTMGPQALLAMALLVEQVADAALKMPGF